MVKKLTVNCDFSGTSHPVDFYIGDSYFEKNPIGFQSKWLAENRGGSVPKDFMDSIIKIKAISDEHNIPFEDLYDHIVRDSKKNSELSKIDSINKKKLQYVAERDTKFSNSASKESDN